MVDACRRWAVSYTHLEVYKRQVSHLCGGRIPRATELERGAARHRSAHLRRRRELHLARHRHDRHLSLIHIYAAKQAIPHNRSGMWYPVRRVRRTAATAR